MNKSTLRRLAINFGVLATTLLLMVLMGEVFLRVLIIQPMRSRAVHIHRPSSVEGLVYELIPGATTRGWGWEHITINSDGYRSPEIDTTKPVIAVIGDSYVFGHGVNDDETNAAYLQKELPDYFVLNAGVDGYNIEQQAIVMKERVAPLNPELVIVEFVFNDMMPKGRFTENGMIDVGVENAEQRSDTIRKSVTQKGLINFPGKVFLQKHSAVFNFIERTTKNLPFRKHAVDTKDTITAENLAFYEDWFVRMNAAVTTKNKIFVIWPESNWHTESRAFLRTLAESRGYIVLDLYDTLGNGYQHLGWDYHPDAAVHEQVAKLIAQTISERGLLRGQ